MARNWRRPNTPLVFILLAAARVGGAADRGTPRRGGSPQNSGGAPSPLAGNDGDIVVTFPIAEGLQPGDYPTRRYQELLEGTGLAQPEPPTPDPQRRRRRGEPERARSLESRESASGRNLRALMREWGQVNRWVLRELQAVPRFMA